MLVVLAMPWQFAVLAKEVEFEHFAKSLVLDSFDSFLEQELREKRPCLVMFHVDWCKVCHRVFPKFANASVIVHNAQQPVDFAHVDCTVNKGLCLRYDVKGYPTIKYFRPHNQAEPLTYSSTRTEEGFLKYVERMSKPVVNWFKSKADLDKALEEETSSVFVVEGEPEALPQEFLRVAERWMDRHVFAAAPAGTALLPADTAAAAAEAGAAVVAYSPGEQQWKGTNPGTESAPHASSLYSGSLTDAPRLEAWLGQNQFPGVWKLDEHNFYAFTHCSRSAVMLVVDPSTMHAKEAQMVRGLARKLGEQFIFGIVDGVTWADELKDFNIASKDLPRVLLTEDNMTYWVEDVEQLRFDFLEQDLVAITEGAPLLRQSRSVLSKVSLYAREARRFGIRVMAYASGGSQQMAVVVGGTATALVLILLGLVVCCRACKSICSGLLDDDPGDSRAKRD